MPTEGGLPFEMIRPKAMSGIVELKEGNARCFDTGATQGMMIREKDFLPYKGPEITILTGNSDVTSNLWANVEIAPGRLMQHVVLPDTPPTVSVGRINHKLGVAFQWLEPSSDKAGEVFVAKRVTGHEVIEGKFELWPLIVKYYTPERHDLDPIFSVNLHHCNSPECKCGLPKLDNYIKKLRSWYGTPGQNISIEDADSDAGDEQPSESVDLLGIEDEYSLDHIQDQIHGSAQESDGVASSQVAGGNPEEPDGVASSQVAGGNPEGEQLEQQELSNSQKKRLKLKKKQTAPVGFPETMMPKRSY